MQEVLAGLPTDSYACFAVDPAHRRGRAAESQDRVARRAGRLVPRPPRRAARFVMPVYRAVGFRLGASWRTHQAVQFGRQHRVDLVCAELQGDALAIAQSVAHGLGVPLIGTVWDDPEGSFADYGYDRSSRSLLRRRFEEALQTARAISTAGEAMQAAYKVRYGIDSVILRHGFAKPALAPPAIARDTVTIGFAGNPYGKETWRVFLDAVAALNTSQPARRIGLRVFGAPGFPHSHPHVPIDIRGWAPAEIMLRDLAQTDFCYLPYWFEPRKRTHVELSFPNKFETYVAATRPTLYHGPAYAGIAATILEYNVGACVHSLDRDVVVRAVADMIGDIDRRRAFERAALAAFEREFNSRVMARNFKSLIGFEDSPSEARWPMTIADPDATRHPALL
jgi:hypothetical protein